MIDWGDLLLVAVVSLIGACVVVTVAAVGIRLFEQGKFAQQSAEVAGRSGNAGRISLAVARVLFAVCALVVLFGVYLIVPAFH